MGKKKKTTTASVSKTMSKSIDELVTHPHVHGTAARANMILPSQIALQEVKSPCAELIFRFRLYRVETANALYIKVGG